MNPLLSLAVLVGLGACAASPLRDAHRMGLVREGALRADSAELLQVIIEVHPEAPRTLPSGPNLNIPDMPELQSSVLGAVAVETARDVGIELGVSIASMTGAASDGRFPEYFRTLLDAEVPAALVLTVHIGWCPAPDGWSACVRSPDAAIGVGPPAIEGFVYSRFKAKKDAAIARRVSRVHKTFVYDVDPSGAHLDRPFIGVGDTVQAQAEDAVRQAVDAWLTVARGRRGQRMREAALATAD